MKKIRWSTLIVIGLFHILSLGILLPQNFSWVNFMVFFGLYVFTGLGITFGFHRLLTHKAFEANIVVRFIAVLAGSLALQGNPIEWVSDHRIHHLFSDTKKDRHNSNWGFTWSHITWLFHDFRVSPLEKKIRENLEKDKLLVFFKYSFVPIQVLLGIILWNIGGWSMVIWGVFFRTVFLYHVTWLVNSATHKWGYRWFETDDNSRNTWWVGLLAFGEGWHNTHHAYQASPRHGIKWWEIDVTWYLIWLLSKLKLVSNLKKIPLIPS
jgi:sn-1 stearoyl-lipid 9-desaturase